MPPNIWNRRRQKWFWHYYLADFFGGDWPERVKAAQEAEAELNYFPRDKGLVLLFYIWTIFRNYPDHPFLRTTIIIENLKKISDSEDDAPDFKDWNFSKKETADKCISDRQISNKLGIFSIKSTKGGERKDAKGYARADIEAAAQSFLQDYMCFKRYQPSNRTTTAVITPHPAATLQALRSDQPDELLDYPDVRF